MSEIRGDPSDCRTCDGSGNVWDDDQSYGVSESGHDTVPCPTCLGSGLIDAGEIAAT